MTTPGSWRWVTTSATPPSGSRIGDTVWLTSKRPLRPQRVTRYSPRGRYSVISDVPSARVSWVTVFDRGGPGGAQRGAAPAAIAVVLPTTRGRQAAASQVATATRVVRRAEGGVGRDGGQADMAAPLSASWLLLARGAGAVRRGSGAGKTRRTFGWAC